MHLPFSRCGCGHASALWLEIKPPLALIYLLLQPHLDENQTPDFALGNWSSTRRSVEAGKRRPSPPTPRHSLAEPFSLEGVTLPLAGLHRSLCWSIPAPSVHTLEKLRATVLPSVEGQGAMSSPSDWRLPESKGWTSAFRLVAPL